MTDTDTLTTNLNTSITTYNHWQMQLTVDQAQTQNDLNAIKGTSSEKGTTSEDSMILAVFKLFNDLLNESGDELACTSAQLEVQSSIDDYNSTIEGYASEGRDISADDANASAQDTYNLWFTLTGGTATTANPYGSCPSWIDPNDQKAMVDNLNDIADSYCNEYNQTTPGKNVPIVPSNGKSFTVEDLYHPQIAQILPPPPAPTPAFIIEVAQTNWAEQVETPSTGGNEPTMGQQDGYFSKLNHAFEQINSLVNTQNQSLTTEQKTWSDEYNSFQGAWKDMQNYFTSTEGVEVNNEAVH